jgi:hypothetical protein
MIKKCLTLLSICAIISLQGCTALGLAKAVLPSKSGTNVNANAQVGKENTQQVVANQENTKIEAENVSVSKKDNDSSITSEKVESLVQNNTNVPMWYLLLLVLGWLLPSPQEIWAGFVNSIERLIHGKKRNSRKNKNKR